MVSREEIEIVLARLRTMPPGLKMSIGNQGTFNKWEMMEQVEKGTEVGKLIADVYMENLRQFKR